MLLITSLDRTAALVSCSCTLCPLASTSPVDLGGNSAHVQPIAGVDELYVYNACISVFFFHAVENN